jgi:hypothetical protein
VPRKPGVVQYGVSIGLVSLHMMYG